MSSFSRIDDIERRLYYYLCGLSISLPLSKALANLFLVLSILGFIHRLICKHDDLARVWQSYKGIFTVTAILMLAVLMSALFSGFIVEGLKSFLDKYLLHISAMIPIAFLSYERKKIMLLLKLLIGGVILSNLTVIIQAVPHISQEYWRFGGVLSAMAQGSLLTMFLPVYILLMIHFKDKRLKLLFLAATLIGVAAIIFNGTRGAWVALAVLVPAVILIQSRSKLKSIGIALAALIAVGGIFLITPQLSNRVATITNLDVQQNAERFKMWQSAFHMFEDHPLLGIGYGQYKNAYQQQYILPSAIERNLEHAHSNVMQMLGECGILGLSAFLLMWIYFTYFCLRGWFKERDISYLLFFSVLWGLMLHGLTEFNFETAVVSKIFWYSLGLLIAYRRLYDS